VQPEDTAALEEARWSEFGRALAELLAASWPAMPERLGERYPSFVALALQRALDKGFVQAAAAARYVNLCFVWGPAFEERAGFEWAQAILAGTPGRWAAMHRLMRRSLAELAQRRDARIEPAALVAADARLIEAFGALGEKGALHPERAPALPLAACDLEGFELRLAEPAAGERYEVVGGLWQRVPVAVPPPLRVDAAQPLPATVGLLARAPGITPAARLQLRVRPHAVCDGDVHPALAFSGSHGRYGWRGHETRAVSWPVATLTQPPAAAGPGTAPAEETSPDIHQLVLATCGLRDEGEALGAQHALVWAWPAEQWWCEIERRPAPAQAVTPDRAVQHGATRCRVECDGRAADARGLQRGFEQGLEAALADALRQLQAAWARVPGLEVPVLDGVLGLLVGQAALTWGWQPGPAGLAGRALMRVVARFAMRAAAAELRLDGELALGAARSRLTLACAHEAALPAVVEHEQPEPPLADALAAARCEFRLPFSAEVVPLGSDSGAVFAATGPVRGALAGAAGLRPRTLGGSGFEWFAQLRLEPVALPVRLVDPLLGEEQRTLELLPALALVDWRLG
jgi:hypothetical protein